MSENAFKVVETPIEEEMKRSYIDYAMSVIVSRALPDVRDGLKPVQRRIIYAMDELGVHHNKPHKKSARLVGDTMGKYHPHGDSAIYDALVRMAQPFNMRYPLIDGHGNFGSIDGDVAAAMRYTEARLTEMAGELMADIDKNTVDFSPNFDESLKEPQVLPSRLPNLMINGSSGIAVGMATNIPPHNLGEVLDALQYLIENPNADSIKLMEFVKGPDFPTGGLIMGEETIKSLYTTGRGVLTVRARTRIEMDDNERQSIIVEELPFQVNKSRLIESIAELVREKKIQGVSDLRDETDKSGLRIVIEVRKDAQAEVVRNQLFKHTSLQTSFGGILIALVDGAPRLLDLKGMLWNYLMHRKEVVIRRTRYELKKAEERAHILAGLAIALANLDEVIALIRSSKNPGEAKTRLMERFNFDEIQAKAILDIKLERLTALERDKILLERDNLLKEIEYFRAVLGSDRMVLGIIGKEFEDMRRKYEDPRRTKIIESADIISDDELIIEEEVTVMLTRLGYIKRMPMTVYRSQRRGGIGATAMQIRSEDLVEKVVATTTRGTLLLFTTSGKVYWLKVYDIPEAGKQARGYPVTRLVQLAENERVTALIPSKADMKGDLFFITKKGICKRTRLDEFSLPRRSGLIALNLQEGDSLILARVVNDGDQVLLVTSKGKALRMRVDDVRTMGRNARGVIGIRLAPDDFVVGADPVLPDSKVLLISSMGYGKVTPVTDFPVHRRGGLGVIALKVTEKSGRMSTMRVVSKNDEAILVTTEGVAIRIKVDQIKVAHRQALGVRLMRIEPPDRLAAISIFEGE